MRLHHFWHWVRVIGAAFVVLFASPLSQGQSHSRQLPVLWQLKGKLQQLAFVPGEIQNLNAQNSSDFRQADALTNLLHPAVSSIAIGESSSSAVAFALTTVIGKFCSIGQRIGQHRPSD